MSELIRYEVDADGIATITWAMEAAPMNILNEASMSAFFGHVETAIADDAVKGAIIASAKKDFIAGADLNMMRQAKQTDTQALYDQSMALHKAMRQMERAGTPFVAAINGTALGGGYEICLACHHRVAADNPKAKIGLPEAKLGLLPGGGGTQRLSHLIGIRDALPLMTEGKTMNPARALKKGLVDQVVPAEDLLTTAKAWLLENPKAKQPWDAGKFRIPGGPVQSPKGFETFVGGNAMMRKATWGNYPAPQAIMACVYHGLQMPLDRGLEYEARKFVGLAQGDVAQNMIRSLFFHLNDANKLKRRPEGFDTATFKKVGVLGAGMMGAGIAYQSAFAGMEVVLLDTSQENAEKGKAYSEAILNKRVERKRISADQAGATLALIHPTTDYKDLADCDIVIEAVFESREIKADVTQKTEAVLKEGAIFASNTSTLPISGLAEASRDASKFIGLHFFSPVEKMPLVEIIMGKETSQETLAHSLDFVRAIKKTPIVVNDSRGFYTSRVFSTYLQEGVCLLQEGVVPALIENAGRMAGMPVGPLAVADEVSLELALKISRQTAEDLGADYQAHPSQPAIETMAEAHGRIGKKAKKGFYDYPEGEKKRLWPGLKELFPPADVQPSAEAVGERLLAIQAIETIRCLEEGVLQHPADADIGSIMGWGFAPFHGGVLSYVDTIGAKAFLERCEALAASFGERFTPPDTLKRMAETNERFHAV